MQTVSIKQGAHSEKSVIRLCRIVLPALCLLTMVTLSNAEQFGDFTYTTNVASAIITGYTGSGGTVEIPGTINGLPVTGIGDWAFAGCTSLADITIPDGVISAGYSTFVSCSSLTNVVIGNGVTNIGEAMFYSCTSLTSVTIPDNVTSIGDAAFQACTSLMSVTIPDRVNSIGYGVFYSCTSLTNVMIGNGVTSIEWGMFKNCRSLVSITIPNSISRIGDHAFFSCPSLTSVTIPESVTEIGSYAFYHCSSLDHITIPGGVTYIGESAFNYCTGLSHISIPHSVTQIGNNVFKDCSSLTSVTILGDLYDIAPGAFYECTSLTNVTILGNITSIGNSAFRYCNSLVSIEIPDSVTSIDHNAFLHCSDLAIIDVTTNSSSFSSIEGVLFDKGQTTLLQCPGGLTGSCWIPENVTNIRDISSFSSVSNIFVATNNTRYSSIDGVLYDRDQTTILRYPGGRAGNYTIPNSVTSIGNRAFAFCSGLYSLTIPNNVTDIGTGAFWPCSSLTSITIPESVTSIGGYPFSFCSSLTNISVAASNPNYSSLGGVLFDKNQTTLRQYPGGLTGSYAVPYGVTSIGHYAFESCLEVTSIMLPDSVSSIGSGAFAKCPLLVNVEISDSVTSIGSRAFFDCSSLTNVTIPDGVTQIGHLTFESCSSLADITIPGSISEIDTTAFRSCISLDSVYFQGNGPYLRSNSLNGNSLTAFDGNKRVTVYYMPGTTDGGLTGPGITDWQATFGGMPTAPWVFPGFAYTAHDGTITIGDYNGSESQLDVPDMINSLTVTSIGDGAFENHPDLTRVTIPAGIGTIGDNAFSACTGLGPIYFLGDAPGLGSGVFAGANNATLYYMPGTTGWDEWEEDPAPVLWNPEAQALSITDGEIGFSITGPPDAVIIVEARENLTDSEWVPLSTNTLTGGVSKFSDPGSSNYPSGYYRFSAP